MLKCKQTVSNGKEKVWFVCWNPSGTILASCGSDKKIILWQKQDEISEKYVCESILEGGHTRTIRSLCWSPCGRFIASSSFDATTSVWVKKEKWECIATLEGHENEVKSVSWSVSGNFLATCSRDKSVWVWEIDEDESFECASVMNSHTQDVKCVKWHPILDIFASASYDDTIKLYKSDGDEWIPFTTLEGHSSTVWSISWSKDGKSLVSCSADKTLKIWREFKESIGLDDGSWKCICTVGGYHERPIYSVDWSSKSDLIATACGDDGIRIFQSCEATTSLSGDHGLSLEMVVRENKAHNGDVNCVSWSPLDKYLLASCGDDGNIKFWRYNEEVY